MSEVYYAKSELDNGLQPTVKEHSEKVSALAGAFASEFGQGDAGRMAGLCHDFGKYSEAFQEVLNHQRQNIDHALPGACMLSERTNPKEYRYVIEAICGHHDGLIGYSELKGFIERCGQDEIFYTRSGKIPSLIGNEQYVKAWKAFIDDFPDFKPVSIPNSASDKMLFTRMLFSCLVDADYSVSASGENPNYLSESEITDFDPNALLGSLYTYQNGIRKDSEANPETNQLRDEVFNQCGIMGEEPEGLFTLTAPTGTGKTLALLHFALRHCAKWGKRRIIIVLPFLTLTEQNADTYRNIYKNLLEDHSQRNLTDEEREYAARWSAPIIVTTSVRFFESLFASKPTDCRKLHSIANSVVIFDEAQSLPAELTVPTLKAVNELCRYYHCTMVFSTATQPHFAALEAMKNDWKPTEILPDNRRLYDALRRTEVDWRIDSEHSLSEIAGEMAQLSSVCAIVNMRKHARELYSLLKEELSDDDGLFFITTDLCTAHRRTLIERITYRLEHSLPCRVVATQCIEAGVDFDFDVMYRALAPLDSIIQAAGRCNRNGRPESGRVIVFTVGGENPYPSTWYSNAAVKVKTIAAEHPIDIHNPDHIKEYYELLFDSAKEKSALKYAIDGVNFAEVDNQYKLINNNGIQVIVPYSNKMELYNSVCEEARSDGITPSLIKRAASITVTVNTRLNDDTLDTVFEKTYYRKCIDGRRIQTNFYLLSSQYANFYTDDMGLQLPNHVEINPFW